MSATRPLTSNHIRIQEQAVRRSKLKLARTIINLKSLAEPIRIAHSQGQTTENDYKSLEEELRLLNDHWQKYEASVDNLRTACDEAGNRIVRLSADNIDNELAVALDEYHKTKLGVSDLLRKIQCQQREIQRQGHVIDSDVIDDDKKSVDNDNIPDEAEPEPKSSSEETPDLDQETQSESEDCSSDSSENEVEPEKQQNMSWKALAKNIGKALILLVMCYFLYYLIISYTLNKRHKEESEGKEGDGNRKVIILSCGILLR